jgi:hypothetical protein
MFIEFKNNIDKKKIKNIYQIIIFPKFWQLNDKA